MDLKYFNLNEFRLLTSDSDQSSWETVEGNAIKKNLIFYDLRWSIYYWKKEKSKKEEIDGHERTGESRKSRTQHLRTWSMWCEG